MRCGWGGQLAQVMSWTSNQPSWNRCNLSSTSMLAMVAEAQLACPRLYQYLLSWRLAAALCWGPASDPDGGQHLFQREMLLAVTIKTPHPPL